MSIDKSDAKARLQRALGAWRVVAASVGDRMKRLGPDTVAVSITELEQLADGFDLMSQLWTELEALSTECDVSAHFIQAKAEPGQVSVTIPREDGRAPMTLKMDASEAKGLGELLIKAGVKAMEWYELRLPAGPARKPPPASWDRAYCYDGELCGCPPGGCCPCGCHEARSRERAERSDAAG